MVTWPATVSHEQAIILNSISALFPYLAGEIPPEISSTIRTVLSVAVVVSSKSLKKLVHVTGSWPGF